MNWEKVNNKTLIDRNRLNVLIDSVNKTKHLEGCMAEIGTYKGGSAYVIASTDNTKQFFVCDSFEGLPELTSEDINVKPMHSKGDFSDTSFESVQEYLNPFPNVQLFKGFFPNKQIHEQMYDKKYSFVHLDVDLYLPTLESLEFFYPRMVTGGIIVSDDYTWKATPGVERAFIEFFKNKSEKIIDTNFKSCYIVKL